MHTELCGDCAAYMEIGTANVSAIIGTYSHPVAMTTDKFSVPYFVTSTPEAHQRRRRQLNVVNMLPLNVDLVAATVDFIGVAQWSSVSVVSQPDRGKCSDTSTVYSRPLWTVLIYIYRKRTPWAVERASKSISGGFKGG